MVCGLRGQYGYGATYRQAAATRRRDRGPRRGPPNTARGEYGEVAQEAAAGPWRPGQLQVQTVRPTRGLPGETKTVPVPSTPSHWYLNASMVQL